MMKDPYSNESERIEEEDHDGEPLYDKRIDAANAIKYTAYVMLFLGFLYFLVAFILPMFD
ncbi:hypothetical protein [Paenibacillus sabinae]|uniref:hypothetical protein n=1 Tax=Paenibacillus sabinae TaxID=365617 RepID=UPI00046CD3D4|nr:hypothetical protein [Paenibacillus sabinae]